MLPVTIQHNVITDELSTYVKNESSKNLALYDRFRATFCARVV